MTDLVRHRCFLGAAVLMLAVAAPAAAQKSKGQDLWITVFSAPTGAEQIAVAYNQKVPEARIQQDLAEVAAALKQPAPRVKVTSGGGIPLAETELSGLTDWRSGAIQLDPLIQTYRRYGRFGITFLFLGNFPLPPLQNIDRPPLRITVEPHGSAVSFWVEVDQSGGVPESLPTAAQEDGSRWRVWLGIGAIALVVAVSVFLVVSVVLGARRRPGAGTGGEQEAAAGRAGPREGKR
jgi:hypothetical protein